jgi:hypothetical protein
VSSNELTAISARPPIARFWTAFACLVLVLVATVLAYHKVTRLWWTYDDTFLLHIVSIYGPSQYFTSSTFWHEMPQQMFVPLLFSWYDALYSRFGASDAAPFYGCALGLFLLAIVASWLALRQWFDDAGSTAGALLIAFGVPMCSIVTNLTVVHYSLSIGFAALSALLYVRAIRTNRFAPAIASAALYLMAVLAKEIAAPLVLALPLLPGRRFRLLTPHVVAALIYLGWRRAMIGTFVGWYGWVVRAEELPRLIAMFPWKVIGEVGGLAIVLLMLPAIAFTARRWWMSIAAMALASAPVLPVSRMMTRRYALMPWICWVVLFLAGIAAMRETRFRRLATPLLALACLAVIAANRSEWSGVLRNATRMSTEARFYAELPAGDLLRQPAVPPFTMEHLEWLKVSELHHPAGAGWFYDDLFVCLSATTPGRIWQWVPAAHNFQQVARSSISCASRDQVPLSADFHHADGTLFWRLGPYRDGGYHFVIANGVRTYDIPAVDGFQLGSLPGITLRVRYDSPAGWRTYSPEIALDFARQPDVHWRR